MDSLWVCFGCYNLYYIKCCIEEYDSTVGIENLLTSYEDKLFEALAEIKGFSANSRFSDSENTSFKSFNQSRLECHFSRRRGGGCLEMEKATNGEKKEKYIFFKETDTFGSAKVFCLNSLCLWGKKELILKSGVDFFFWGGVGNQKPFNYVHHCDSAFA